MGLYTLAMAGTSPIGQLLTGVLTNAFGIRTTLAIWGAVCALFVCAAITYRLRSQQLATRVQTVRDAVPVLVADLDG
jgi:cyanate permease